MNEQRQPRRTTKCLEAGQLMAWLDGDLSPQAAEEVQSHLASCTRCAAEERLLKDDRHRVFDILSTLEPPSTADVEPTAAFVRLQRRLTETNAGMFLPHADENLFSEGLVGSESASQQHGIMGFPTRPAISPRRSWALVQILVAAMIIVALLSSTLLLVRPWFPISGRQPNIAPSGSIGTPVTVHAQAGKLEMTLQITPGPYFLSEMLAVEMSLTNRSSTTVLLQGTPHDPNPYDPPSLQELCYPPLTLVMSGGNSPATPTLQRNLATAMSCSSSPELGPSQQTTTQLQPTQTVTVHQYVALTSSGNITLTARGVFQKVTLGKDGVGQVVSASGPLDGHWPSLRIRVQTQVPSTRMLSLQQQGTHIIVHAPPATIRQLIYISVFDCNNYAGGTSHGGSSLWRSLPTSTLPEPQCGSSGNGKDMKPDTLILWTFVVGVPGYTLVSGTYPSQPA